MTTVFYTPNVAFKDALELAGREDLSDGFEIDCAVFEKLQKSAKALHPDYTFQQMADWAAYSAKTLAEKKARPAVAAPAAQVVMSSPARIPPIIIERTTSAPTKDKQSLLLWLWRLAILAVLLGLAVPKAHCQSQIENIQFLNSSDVLIKTYAAPFKFKCGTGTTCTAAGNKITLVTTGSGLVPTSRTISTTAPLAGGGDLSADRTFSITQSGTGSNGYLSSTDWNTFNSKQAALSISAFTATSPLALSQTASIIGAAASAVSISKATTSVDGYLDHTDWTTFNNKLSSSAVSGTAGTLAKFTASNTVGNSVVTESSGGRIGIGLIEAPSAVLDLRLVPLTGGTITHLADLNGMAFLMNSSGQSVNSKTGFLVRFETDPYVIPAGVIMGREGSVWGTYIAFHTSSDGPVNDQLLERMRINRNGNVGIGTTYPTSPLQVVGLPVYANNAAAVAGGLTVGAFYRTGADPDPVCVVH